MSPNHPKNPLKPKVPLQVEPKHLITYGQALWRIHTTVGAHPTAWDELRTHGPISRFRWDPHPAPIQTHLEAAVSYAATGFVTAFAEVFQHDQAITLSASRALSGWYPGRALTLLDLVSSDWAVHHGASASLPQATTNICRNWSNSIWEELSRGTDAVLDGLYVPSTTVGDPMVVLFPRARDAFPATPDFSRSLNHSAVAAMATSAAARLRWAIR